MIRQLWIFSIHTRLLLRRYMPTNILLNAVRGRRGLKWGVPAMLLAVPYLIAASTLTSSIAESGIDCLYVLVLLCLWNAMKFIAIGPISVACLIRTSFRKASGNRSLAEDRVTVGRLE